MIVTRVLLVASILGAALLLAGRALPATQRAHRAIYGPESHQIYVRADLSPPVEYLYDVAPTIDRSNIHKMVAALFTVRLSELLKLARRLAIKT